ncbi:MAG: hypothetical protein ACTSYQ_01065 [Candidatus Odinarchaeia archaeon]
MINQIYAVFVIKKDNGVCLFSKACNPLPNGSKKTDYDKYSILTGLISAVSNIVTHVADDYIKHLRLEGEDRIKIIIETFSNIAVGVVASKNLSDRKITNLARNLVKQFDYLYGDILDEWKGDLSKFKIFNKVLDMELGKTNQDFTDYL